MENLCVKKISKENKVKKNKNISLVIGISLWSFKLYRLYKLTLYYSNLSLINLQTIWLLVWGYNELFRKF